MSETTIPAWWRSEETYRAAVELVMRDQKPSTSYVQRKLQLGYNAASEHMERMEREGIVGPRNHAGQRALLISPSPSQKEG